jgi:hypothetical protein
MIERVSNSSGVSPATDLTQKAASTKTLCTTPFGDVMVDHLSTPNLAVVFSGRRSEAGSAPPATLPAAAVVFSGRQSEAGSAPPATLPAAAEPAAQAGVLTATRQAAVVAPPSTLTAAVAAVETAASDLASAPTAQSVFGSQPWLAAPTGSNPDGTQFGYNPIYFATLQTAQQIAAMVGGQVIEQKAIAPDGPIHQQTPNEMIRLSDGRVVNPGLIAAFYTHGYPQSYIDLMIQNEIQGT